MNTKTLIHDHMVAYWKQQYEDYERRRYDIPTRFQRAEGIIGVHKRTAGDLTLAELNDLFMNGFGTIWSPVQLKIWKAIVDALLPLIYGPEWDEVKKRVMEERGLKHIGLEVLVNMARRNGKTWIVAGACVAIFLKLHGKSIAIFSVGKRQSGMFLTCCQDKLKAAFKKGSHARETDYKQLQKNQEVIIYELADGSKNTLASLPGSITVK